MIHFLLIFKMLGFYLDTLIVFHRLCSMLSKLNELIRKVLVPGVGLEPRPSVRRSAALPTELAGQFVIGLVPVVLHYTYYF